VHAGKAGAGLALVVAAAVGFAIRGSITEMLAAGGARESQRALAGGTGGTTPPAAGPVRVVLLDGLSAADAPRLPAFQAMCAAGTVLTVDVGFPTKSLPVQRVLWSGLTAQQQGDRADNLPRPPPPSSIPLALPGAIAVVESHPEIARDAGFADVVSDDSATWRDRDFAEAAAEAAASDAPLVLIHVLAIDVAAHAHGRRGAAYDAALASADRSLAAVLAAAPHAQWLVLSDHGHVADGGHGDAEREVRFIRACWSPAVPRTSGEVPRTSDEVPRTLSGTVLLPDVSRWLFDALHLAPPAGAVGRTLEVAVAHPDPDATLPGVGILREIVAGILLVIGVAVGVRFTPRRWPCAWPLASLLLVAIAHGLPTLSHRPSFALLALAGVVPGAAAAFFAVPRAPVGRALAALAPAGGCVAAVAVLSRIPDRLCGAAAHVPWWTGLFGAQVLVFGVVGAVFGLFLTVTATRQR
jgi:hypothetical protein